MAVARWSGPAEISPEMRFIAFALATMGLAWLTGIFVLRRFDWAGLFRWAAAVDVFGIALVVGAAASGAVGWAGGLKLYAILASFAMLQLAAVWLVWRLGGSMGGSAGIAVLLAVLGMTTLIWGHLPARLVRADSAGGRAVLTVVRYANPLLAANDALNPPTRFDWSRHGWMYSRYGIIGEARQLGLPGWPIACGIYLAVAAVLAGAGLIVRRRRPDIQKRE